MQLGVGLGLGEVQRLHRMAKKFQDSCFLRVLFPAGGNADTLESEPLPCTAMEGRGQLRLRAPVLWEASWLGAMGRRDPALDPDMGSKYPSPQRQVGSWFFPSRPRLCNGLDWTCPKQGKGGR